MSLDRDSRCFLTTVFHSLGSTPTQELLFSSPSVAVSIASVNLTVGNIEPNTLTFGVFVEHPSE